MILTSFLLGGPDQSSFKKPNVIIVLTDDQGYGDLSCHGNPVLKTPNLDRLFSESIRLTDYHVAPTCSPTRAGLITGKWSIRTGVWHTIMGRSMLRDNELTIGQIMKDGGYRTGMFGKWHLGDNFPYRAEDRGFEEVMRHGGGGIGQTPDYWNNAYFDDTYFHNGIPEPVQGYCTDVFFDNAKQFIQKVKAEGNPFFVYLSTNTPHSPMHSPHIFSAPYKDLGVRMANFFGMIANIDHNIGKMRDFLEHEGLAENTIFIFSTDNGSSAGVDIFNDGMRGRKGSEYDGGHRVPFFLHWPAGGLTNGRNIDMITSYVDLVPTLIDFCNIPSPIGVNFDGISIRPLIEKRAKDWPDRILITDSQRIRDPIKWRKSAVMTDRWRLINGKELYDMDSDPGQKENVAMKHLGVVQRLVDFYENWWDELKPSFGNPTAIYLGHPNPLANPVTLTSHDWITERSTPWNQEHIRKAWDNKTDYGFWAVDIKRSGIYEVELRRWPKEANMEITSELLPGSKTPGQNGYRTSPGKPFKAVNAHLILGGQELSAPVGIKDKSISFKINLELGRDELWARFTDDSGGSIGAFYVYVTRLEESHE